MPLRLNSSIAALLSQPVHHFATLWRIERTVDTTVMLFTDHDRPVTFSYNGTDEIYTPAGGWSATAREKQAGIRDHNLETKGVLDSAAITDEDLRAGKYQEARVVEMLVDWKAPFAGAFQANIYFISGMTYDNEMWTAQLSGQPVWMRKDIGTVLSKVCRFDLGYGVCGQGVDLSAYKVGPVAVDSIEERRRAFTSAALVQAAGYFNYGEMLWLTGANAGLRTEIIDHQSGGKIFFSLQTPYDIAAGDTFNIWPGCDRTLDTCINKFGNVVNFGGFPGIIGTDRMVGPPAQDL